MTAMTKGMADMATTESEWEKIHTDNGHIMAVSYNMMQDPVIAAKLVEAKDCWICHPRLNPKYSVKKGGHTNTVAHSHRSHAACDHPRTPRDRAACRKAGGPNN